MNRVHEDLGRSEKVVKATTGRKKVVEEEIITPQVAWPCPTCSRHATCGSSDNAPPIHRDILLFSNSKESFFFFPIFSFFVCLKGKRQVLLRL